MKLFYFLVVMRFVVPTVAKECGPCVVPKYVTFEGSNFFVETTLKLSWFSAVEYCNYLGMRLLKLDSEEQLLFLARYLETLELNRNYWVSGSRMWDENYRWMTTGEHIDVKDTKINVPIAVRARLKDEETCVFLNKRYRFKMDGSDCYTERLFICEKFACETC